MRLKRLCRFAAVALTLIVVAVWSFIITAVPGAEDVPPPHDDLLAFPEKPKSGKRDLNSNINKNARRVSDRTNHIPNRDSIANDNSNKNNNKNTKILAPNLYRDSVNSRNDSRKTAKNSNHRSLIGNMNSSDHGPNEWIKRAILQVNHEQRILNLARFPRRSANSVVILVMVHKRIEYLQYLIESLRRARDIEDALLVFSHDYYSEEINAVVQSVDFCQTLQIFYPYSLQIYENQFPGPEANDCGRDISKQVAKEIKCTNWEHPDLYGHYREVRFVMTKHHWFWKLQHIFTGVRATRDHEGLVLLLEEDHYVAPDFYVMLKKMYQEKQRKLPECNILTLGTYDKNRIYRDRADKADVTDWHSSKHNMGMALDKKTWQSLQTCKEQFCSYDDYNWDWTLQHLSKSCLKPPLMALVLRSPRVFHIGECGIHHNGKCNADELVRKIDETLHANERWLFPLQLVAAPQTRPLRVKPPKPNGGWGDLRDHTLCATYGRDGMKEAGQDTMVVV